MVVDPVTIGGWICTITNMHQFSFLPVNVETTFGCFFLEKAEASYKVCKCVTEHSGVTGILQVCQIVVAQSDSCDPLADSSHYVMYAGAVGFLGMSKGIGVHIW